MLKHLVTVGKKYSLLKEINLQQTQGWTTICHDPFRGEERKTEQKICCEIKPEINNNSWLNPDLIIEDLVYEGEDFKGSQ